jgi:hypothetical protein
VAVVLVASGVLSLAADDVGVKEATMSDGPVPMTVSGMVQRLDNSGIGPNSGEIILVIQPENGPIVEVFAGILGSTKPPAQGIEGGVYASYVTIALAAMATGRQLSCTYLPLDKPRITGLSILQVKRS